MKDRGRTIARLIKMQRGSLAGFDGEIVKKQDNLSAETVPVDAVLPSGLAAPGSDAVTVAVSLPPTPKVQVQPDAGDFNPQYVKMYYLFRPDMNNNCTFAFHSLPRISICIKAGFVQRTITNYSYNNISS